MKKLFTFFLFAVATGLHAQPVLQSADFFPWGASATVSVTGSLTQGTGGADQTWDFSGLTLTPAITLTAVDPSTTPYYSQFGESNYAWKLESIGSGNVAYNYYNLTSSVFEAVGTGITTSTGTDYTPNPRGEIEFPLNYNESFTDTFQTTTDLPETISYTYDGYGTVMLPSETVTNAVRLVRYDNGSSTPSRYLWLRTNPLMLMIDFNIDNNSANIITNVLTGIETTSANTSMTIFPNPSNGIFNIACETATSKVEVFNVSGQKVFETSNIVGTSVQIDLSAQPQGVYFCKILSQSKTIQTTILVKE